jgi:exodeoxyribonuclease VII large subunit
MGVEPDDERSGTLADLEDRLGSDSVAFADALNDRIGGVIEDAPDLRVDYVVGDASDVFVSSGGHLHFDVVHEGSSIHCVVFGFRFDRMEVEIEDGLQIAVKGDLSYHEDEGQVSILGEDVVKLGEGLYERTYQQNRAILEEDGLLADDAKQRLPDLPECVGIVTSAESDAREDAVTSIHDRYPDVDIVVCNAAMQGTTAMQSMMGAISELDDDARIDVIVLTRGGGADKHLRVFNETPLCRVIANTDTPIVVGVGHENDRSLADEVGDRRVMTPTHVGEIVPDKADLVESISTLEERLDAAHRRLTVRTVDEFDRGLSNAYADHVSATLDRLETDLDHAFETAATERVLALDSQLDHAYDSFQQQARFQEEKSAVAEQYAQSRRRRQALILALLLLIILLLVYILA